MKSIFTVLKGNIKRSKGVYISIFAIMLFLSISISAITTVTTNARNRDEKVMDEVGYGDMIGALRSEETLAEYGVTTDEVVSSLRNCSAVGEVKTLPISYVGLIDCNGKSSGNSIFMIDYENDVLDFSQYNSDGKKIKNPRLKGNEISIPICYKEQFGCEIGDTIIIGSDDMPIECKVVSYLEDPFMGSSLMGIKTFLCSKEMLDRIQSYGDKYESMSSSTYLMIYKADKNMKDLDFEKAMNRECDYAAYCFISLSKEQASTYMLMLVNIFSGVLVVFVILLLVVTLIVLGHNINSSIEQDYVNLGILKSVGVTTGGLKAYIMIGYLIFAASGFIIGIPLSIPLSAFVNSIIGPSLGLYFKSTPNFILIACIFVALMAFLALFIVIKTGKISKITPVVAMNEGKHNVHFSSILKAPISKKMLSFTMAYRQFISGIKQYFSVIIITSLLSVFMIMINDMVTWINADDTLEEIFIPVESNMNMFYSEQITEDEIEEIVASYGYKSMYHRRSTYMMFNDVLTNTTILDKPELVRTVYKGRSCNYENEFITTQFVIDKYGLKLGDEVEIGIGGKKAKFILVGVYDCGNDTGNNLLINYEGFKRIGTSSDIKSFKRDLSFVVTDESKLPEIREAILKADKGMGERDIWIDEGDDGSFGIIKVAISGIAVLIYVLSAVFITISVTLVCSKIFAREKRDIGIYKSLGFTSKRLRVQLGLRFVLSAVIGSLLGIVLTMLVSKKFLSVIFASFGLYHFESHVSFMAACIPLVAVSAIFFVISYMLTRKVSKIDPRILIVE